MSGAGLPYRLRPHKAVDRRLFLELLTRWERWQPLHRHAYVSMAGYTMEDQKLVHRVVGIDRLLAFDMDANIVGRQLFNRPTEEAKCIVATADEITADIDQSVLSAGIEDAAGYVVWLDYTSPRQIRNQINEFTSLASQLSAGDIVRVTVNAAPQSWGAGQEDRRPGQAVPSREERRASIHEMLRSRLGDLLPADVLAESLDDEGLAVALARSFGIAGHRAVNAGSLRLEPLSIVRYADGLQMLSITAGLVEAGNEGEMRERLSLAEWPFAVENWQRAHLIVVPDLTIRERLYLERHTHRTTAEIGADVGFNFDQASQAVGFLENYRSYYRHYPVLSPIEL